MADPNLSSFIWSVADLLRGDYKQSEYGKVILPFTVLRRLDCVLEATKPAVLAEIGRSGLAFEGFHLFSGSQSLRAEAICDAQSKALELAVQLAAHAPAAVTTLNLGGGFGIPYFSGTWLT